MWNDLWYRLRALVRRDAVDRELDDELKDHLARQVDRNRQTGLSEAEATRLAHLQLGGIDQIKEDVRDSRGVAALNRLAQDGRYAWRVLCRRPAFTAAVVLTLGFGIGATTTMFSVVDGLVLRSLPYPNADRLVQIGTTFGPARIDSAAVARYLDAVLSSISTPDFAAVRTRAQTLAGVAAARGVTMDAAMDGDPLRLGAAAVSASFFDVLGARPALGRGFGAEHDLRGAEPVALLSHALWQRHLNGDAGVIGRSIVLDGMSYDVIGVLPAWFRGPDALDLGDTDVWLPLGRSAAATASASRDDTAIMAIARLGDDRDIASARRELDDLATALAQEHPGTKGRFWVESLRARTLGDSDRPLWLLFGAVGVLLLIACANVTNLFLVRATERTREMAVRAAMGAGQGRIARQLLTESAVFGLASGALGAALAFGGVALFVALAPPDLPRLANVSVNLRVLGFALGISLVAGLVFGIVPAIDAMGASLSTTLRQAAGSVTTGRPRTRLRSALVVSQTMLALVLLICGGLLANSLARLATVDPGFDPRQVVWLDITVPTRAYPTATAKAAFLDELLTRGRGLPGVRDVAFIAGRPLGGGNSVASVAAEHRLPAEGDSVARVPFHVITPGYFDALGVPRIDGRDFDATDALTAPRAAIVSRSFAERFWPNERAVGKRFWMGRVARDAPLTVVVGVVEDVRHYGLTEPGQPMVYHAQSQMPRGSGSLIVRHEGPAADVIRELRTSVWSLNATIPLDDYGTLEGLLRAALGEPRLGATVFGTFSAIATAFACVGLYGTLAWIVRARRREMGIRLVLGAESRDLRRLVIRRGLGLAATGIGLGLVVAWFASRLLSSLVFGISTTDLPTFAGTAAAMAGIAWLACWIPARRAASLDPVSVLRDQ